MKIVKTKLPSAGESHQLSHGKITLWLNLGLAALVVVLVGGRLLWLRVSHSQHQEIAAAFGSVSLFYGEAQPNHDGSQLTYVATSDHGFAVFLCEVATGRKKIICEENGLGSFGEHHDLAVWPWSPDDKAFIYTTGKNKITIHQNDPGGNPAKTSLSLKKPASSIVWLDSDKFACVNAAGNLDLFSRGKAGQWEVSRIGDIPPKSSSLAALSSTIVAWNQANSVWSLNLNTKAVTQLYQAPSGQTLESFNWSPDDKRFLMKFKRGNEASLWWVALGKAPVKILPLPTGSPTEPGRLFTHKLRARTTTETFTASPDGKKLFFVGAVSNEPAAGICQYDLGSGQMRAVVSSSDQPSPYASNITPTEQAIKLPSGRSVDCTIYPPVNLNPHKKYPLVLGNTMFGVAINGAHGRLWVPGMAACGAYVVIINRRDWSKGIEQWEENVMGVYKQLLPTMNIDPQQVFLFGASAETRYISELIEKSPGLWKGIIFLNPSGLPDFSQSPCTQSRPKILISTGGEEHLEKFYKQFQTNSLNFGVITEIVVHPGETHHLVGNIAQLKRTQALMHFIFEE